MIWHDETLTVPNQPLDSTVRLIGKYNNPADSSSPNIIELSLVVDGFVTLLYTHNPSGLSFEEPIADDVLARYVQKVGKARRKIIGTDYSELSSIRKII